MPAITPFRFLRLAVTVLVLLLALAATSHLWGQRRHVAVIAASPNAVGNANNPDSSTPVCCKLPTRFPASTSPASGILSPTPSATPIHRDMAWIPAGEFTMGSDAEDAEPQERPAHRVRISGFWMDRTDVTNAQFRQFVEATGYVTTAERPPDWEQMKLQLPPGTPKPADDQLVAASLVFVAPDHPVPLDDVSVWWRWTPGANWRHPPAREVPSTARTITQSCKSVGTMPATTRSGPACALPTEAEWEYAARGGLEGKRYFWGDDDPISPRPRCNIWQGIFPYRNDKTNGDAGPSPVKTFPPTPMASTTWPAMSGSGAPTGSTSQPIAPRWRPPAETPCSIPPARLKVSIPVIPTPPSA